MTPQGIELFALDKEGAVLHKSVNAAGSREWQRIGEGMAGSLNAFTTPRGEIGVIALGRDGKVMYLAWSAGTPRDADWRPLGKAPPGVLSAEFIDDLVVLAVLDDDEMMQAAAWPTNPEPPAKLEWRKLGAINALVSARYSLLHHAQDATPGSAT